jgi:hypothetical protein
VNKDRLSFLRMLFGFKRHLSNSVRYYHGNIVSKATLFKHSQRKEKCNGWQDG